jgi:membrane protease YdiL (CAAX protease family)
VNSRATQAGRLTLTLLVALLAVPSYVLCVRFLAFSVLPRFGLSRTDSSTLAAGYLVFLVLLFASITFTHSRHAWALVAPTSLRSFLASLTPALALLLLFGAPKSTFSATPITSLSLALLPATIEEIICRGFLFHWLRRWSVFVVALVSASVFALGHSSLIPDISTATQCWFLLNSFCFGIALCGARALSGSVLPTVILHGLFNLVFTCFSQQPLLSHSSAWHSWLPASMFAIGFILIGISRYARKTTIP